MVGSDDEVEVARQERWLRRIREQFDAEQQTGRAADADSYANDDVSYPDVVGHGVAWATDSDEPAQRGDRQTTEHEPWAAGTDEPTQLGDRQTSEHEPWAAGSDEPTQLGDRQTTEHDPWATNPHDHRPTHTDDPRAANPDDEPRAANPDDHRPTHSSDPWATEPAINARDDATPPLWARSAGPPLHDAPPADAGGAWLPPMRSEPLDDAEGSVGEAPSPVADWRSGTHEPAPWSRPGDRRDEWDDQTTSQWAPPDGDWPPDDQGRQASRSWNSGTASWQRHGGNAAAWSSRADSSADEADGAAHSNGSWTPPTDDHQARWTPPTDDHQAPWTPPTDEGPTDLEPWRLNDDDRDGYHQPDAPGQPPSRNGARGVDPTGESAALRDGYADDAPTGSAPRQHHDADRGRGAANTEAAHDASAASPSHDVVSERVDDPWSNVWDASVNIDVGNAWQHGSDRTPDDADDHPDTPAAAFVDGSGAPDLAAEDEIVQPFVGSERANPPFDERDVTRPELGEDPSSARTARSSTTDTDTDTDTDTHADAETDADRERPAPIHEHHGEAADAEAPDDTTRDDSRPHTAERPDDAPADAHDNDHPERPDAGRPDDAPADGARDDHARQPHVDEAEAERGAAEAVRNPLPALAEAAHDDDRAITPAGAPEPTGPARHEATDARGMDRTPPTTPRRPATSGHTTPDSDPARRRPSRPMDDSAVPAALASLRQTRRPDDTADPTEALRSLQAQLDRLGSTGRRPAPRRPRRPDAGRSTPRSDWD